MSSNVRNEGDSESAQDWLDGLTGRPGEGSSHAEGALLRQSLETATTAALPPWEEIERQAGLDVKRTEGSTLGPTSREAGEAANQGHWRPWHGIAAALALTTVLAASMWTSDPEVTMRGGQHSRSANDEQVWHVAEPQQAAQSLAAELRALGAEVQVQADAKGSHLRIAAPTAAVRTVNERLMVLETALDAQGRVSLLVVSP